MASGKDRQSTNRQRSEVPPLAGLALSHRYRKPRSIRV